jgi:hypothetical protein
MQRCLIFYFLSEKLSFSCISGKNNTNVRSIKALPNALCITRRHFGDLRTSFAVHELFRLTVEIASLEILLEFPPGNDSKWNTYLIFIPKTKIIRYPLNN